MRRAALLVLFLAATGLVQANGLLAPAQPAFDQLQPVLDQTPLAGVLAGAPWPSGGPDPAPAGDRDCGGTAPLTTACRLDLTGAPGQTYQLFTNAGTGFTGTIVATLADDSQHMVTWTCAYTLFVGGVTPGPDCRSGGSGDLQGGGLQLLGAATEATSGAPSAGYWDVGVVVR